MLVSELYKKSNVVVLVGSSEITDSVAFRCANEAAAIGGRVLYIHREQQAALPLKLTITNINNTSVKDSFFWRIKLLQNLDECYVNSVVELKRALAMVQTLTYVPSTIILQNLSELIDPLCATAHADFEFLNQVMMLRYYLDDACNALRRSSTDEFPRVVITDNCTLDASHVAIIARDGATVVNCNILHSNSVVTVPSITSTFIILEIRHNQTDSNSITASLDKRNINIVVCGVATPYFK